MLPAKTGQHRNDIRSKVTVDVIIKKRPANWKKKCAA